MHSCYRMCENPALRNFRQFSNVNGHISTTVRATQMLLGTVQVPTFIAPIARRSQGRRRADSGIIEAEGRPPSESASIRARSESGKRRTKSGKRRTENGVPVGFSYSCPLRLLWLRDYSHDWDETSLYQLFLRVGNLFRTLGEAATILYRQSYT